MNVQLDVVVGNVTLGSGIQVMLQLLQAPLAVDQEDTAGLDVLNDLEAAVMEALSDLDQLFLITVADTCLIIAS